MESDRIFDHEPMGIFEEVGNAPEAYSGFDKRGDVVKPVIKFDGAWSK